jgi:hypothetical protein
MEDLIYLVILIAWAVFAFYRQSQKKKAAARAAESKPAPPPPSYEPKGKSWEEILFGEEVTEEHEIELEPEPEPDFRKDKRTIAYEPISLEQKYMQRKIESLEDPKVQERMEREKSILLEEEEEEFRALDRDNFLKDFDLRKAVILSEILNRPYE